MVQTVMNMAALFQNIRVPHDATPVRVSLPPPPELSAALSPNTWLTKAQSLAALNGVQSLLLDHLGYAYVTLASGWTAEIRPNGQVRGVQRPSWHTCGVFQGQAACGRPMGLRQDSQGILLVADSDHGIFGINRWTGRYVHVLNTQQLMINNRLVGDVNDLAVKQDGTIFFTSSSSRWRYRDRQNIVLEGESTGRVLMIRPQAKGDNRVQQVVAGLSYPSGLELAKDESYLLIAEAARAKIHKLWLSPKHPRYGQVDTFVENLPGFPANIRLSPRGTLWVPMSNVRFKGRPSVLDTYGDLPHMRRDLMGVPTDVFQSRYGLVVEVNAEGKVVRSLQDPDGTLFPAVSQVTETPTGRLYIVSPESRVVGLLSLHSLPTPVQAVSASPAAALPPAAAPPLPALTSVMEDMLNQMKKQMVAMTPQQLKDVVVMLFKQVFEERVTAKTALNQMTKMTTDVLHLKQMMALDAAPEHSSATSGSSSSTAAAPRSNATVTGTGSGSTNDVKQTTALPGGRLNGSTNAIDSNCVLGPSCGIV